MPLVEPGEGLREKVLLIGGGGSGKTTAWLSVAWWAKQSEDSRVFYVCDTDDESVLQVMNESKYDGMLRSFNDELVNENGNIVLTSVADWDDYLDFSQKAVANAVKGDWIVIDFITHAWKAAQDGFIQDLTSQSQTRDGALYEAGVKGSIGWDMYKGDIWNWQAINSAYDLYLKPVLLKSRAHVFMTSEEEQIQEGNRMSPDQKDHVQQWGKHKFIGQKKLPYQCRTYLRIQRLARGRVLYTLKDRARDEFNGEDCVPDFMTRYLKQNAGWSIA